MTPDIDRAEKPNDAEALKSPADHIRARLNALGWTQADLVRTSGLPKGSVSSIIQGRRPIGPKSALGLQRAFGEEATYWLKLQAGWDYAEKRKR